MRHGHRLRKLTRAVDRRGGLLGRGPSGPQAYWEELHLYTGDLVPEDRYEDWCTANHACGAAPNAQVQRFRHILTIL